jgi:hypothetical protein
MVKENTVVAPAETEITLWKVPWWEGHVYRQEFRTEIVLRKWVVALYNTPYS